MRILAVNTSTQAGGLAILEDGRLIQGIFARSDEEYSSRLFRELDFLLQQTGLKLPNFDAFAVAVGPGSFTALRIGMTAVKAWAEIYRKPVCPVSGLKALACQTTGDPQFVVAVMDARRGQVFGGLFDAAGGHWDRIGEEVVMRPEELLTDVASRIAAKLSGSVSIGKVSFVSPAPMLISEALLGSEFADCRVEAASEELAPWIGKLAFDQVKRGETVSALTLDANYIRRTDAEHYWKDS